MRAVFKPNIRSFIRLALAAASVIAVGCSSAGAEEQTQAQKQAQAQTEAQPVELWRCVARNAFYAEREGGLFPTTTVISGKLVFHSVSHGSQWQPMASIHFMSVNADPDMSHGNGITAIVPNGEPDRIQIFMVVGGESRRLGSYPKGTPVPYKISFDDTKGTVTLESGKFAMTAKSAQLQRPHFDMKCSGADVSFTDFVSS